MKEITVKELKDLRDSQTPHQLIDVREPNEVEIADMGGELIPMNSIPSAVDKIAKDVPVVIHCRSGKRSADVIHWLEANHNFDNLHNLVGGILAWADEIDPSIQKY